MMTLSGTFLPKYYTKNAILYFSLIICLAFYAFFNKFLSIKWLLFDLVEVIGFFYFSQSTIRNWSKNSVKVFQRKLFRTSLWIRIVWVFFSYFYFLYETGKPFEFEAADAIGYHHEGIWLRHLLMFKKFDEYIHYIGKNYADMGYPFYLGLLYYVIGDGVLIPRLIKAFLGAYTCILTYKLATNNFDESIGRVAGIMVMLVPNLIYYTGLHVKETEMVFLTVYFVYMADKVIRSKQPRFVDILLLTLLLTSLFFFRTVLAGCLFGSVAVAVFLTSGRVSSLGKRIGMGALLLMGVFIISYTPLADNIYEHIQARNQNIASQMSSFATRGDGNNKLARYGSRSVFLPLILVAPFPTLVETQQPNAMMLGGAFFTRNVYAFFILIALFALYKHKEFKYHILLLAVVFSYLFVLASSGFALSERFHLPLVPFLLTIAAYGISQLNQKNKKLYIPYLMLISIIVIGWNWFKLAGRS